MARHSIQPLAAAPEFDLELLMNTCQETRISGDILDTLNDAWQRWLPLAHAGRIESDGESYLLVWLEKAVEDEVDDTWGRTPSEGLIVNALAQVMCMGLVHSLLPQVEEMGCAPAPAPTLALAEALEEAGAPYLRMGEPGLARRYAVVTRYPYKGGCEMCALKERCPKNGGMSITLPGHE
jgi:hypothetical protein